jgi:hypothetical protein
VEGHGKCYCDTHFSRISGAVVSYELEVGPIFTINTLHEVLTTKYKYYKDANELFGLKRKMDAVVTFIIKDPVVRPEMISRAQVDNFKCYYSFVVSPNGNLLGKEIQNSSNSVELKVKPKQKRFDRKLRVTKRKELDLKPNSLWKKEQKRRKLFNKSELQIQPLYEEEILASSSDTWVVSMDIDSEAGNQGRDLYLYKRN